VTALGVDEIGASPAGGARGGQAATPIVTAAPLRYRPDIDGLRAVAVLSVIAYHAFPDWFPGGFVGVDIFFVISGFLITSIILEQIREGTFTIGRFYARRIRRIFPALVVILLFCIAFGWMVLLPQEYRQLGKHIAAGAGFSSNFVLWREAGYFDVSADTKPLLHLWSLGIEEQFYFFWPAAIYWAWKRKLSVLATTLVLLLGSFALNVAFLGSKAVATFYLPFTRVWELLIGAVLAYLSQQNQKVRMAVLLPSLSGPRAALIANARAAAGVGLLATAWALLNRNSPFPGWWALVPSVGAFLLISAGTAAWINKAVLSHRLLVWFGLISFPLYLWHWPLLAFAHVVEGARPGPTIRLVAVVASVLFAWLTFVVIEKRLRFRRGAERPLLAACFVVLLIGLAMWQGWLDPRHSSREIKSVAAAIADWDYPPTSFARLEYGGQRFFARTGGLPGKVLYLGDSIAEQYAPRVDYLLTNEAASTKSVVFAVTGGCPPIPGVVLDRAKECQPRLEAARRFAETSDVGTVVVAACWYCYFHVHAHATPGDDYYVSKGDRRLLLTSPEGQDLAMESFARFLTALTKQKKVFVILSSPSGDGVNPAYLLTGSRFGTLKYKESAGFTRSEFEFRFGSVNERLRKIAVGSGATVVDPMPAMCPGGVCSALAADGAPIYADGVHIRSSYVRQFASFIDVTMKARP
jgi:peptidoglycan/LPS O-acetylase OafA/YrhL